MCVCVCVCVRVRVLCVHFCEYIVMDNKCIAHPFIAIQHLFGIPYPLNINYDISFVIPYSPCYFISKL